MGTDTPKDTPRERRKKKAQQATENRNKPVVESVGKNTPANSFVPESEEPTAPSIPTVAEDIPKAPTLSDMLASQRKTAVQEKTDAAKMQKYYALTDVLGALGNMGGVAVGGAIGGNMMDSAPIVGEYKESRGYLNAFEKAKQANARLRELDNTQYQLAARDEERSYKQQQDKLNRDYQRKLIDYKNQIDRANADRDYERSKELKIAIADMEQKHKKEIAELNNKYEQENLKLKNQYRQSEQAGSRANMQYQHDLYNTVPLAFNDGTGIRMSKNDYEGLLKFFNGKKIGNVTVNKDNIDTFLRDNPKLVNDYITAIGGASVADNTKPAFTEAKDEPTATNDGLEYPLPFQRNQNVVTMPEDIMASRKSDSSYSVETDPFASFLS